MTRKEQLAIEEQWNGLKGKDCNIQVSVEGISEDEWESYRYPDESPSWSWGDLTYRVKPGVQDGE